MVDVTHILLVNTGAWAMALIVLFALWVWKPTPPDETPAYLSRDLHKIKKQVVDSE